MDFETFTSQLFECETEESMATLLLRAVRVAVGASRCAVLARGTDEVFRPCAHLGLDPAALRSVWLQAGPSILWGMLRGQKPLAVSDAGDKAMFPLTFRRYGLEHLQSSLWFPMVWEGEVTAILTMNVRPREVSPISRLCERTAWAWGCLKARRDVKRLREQVNEQRKVLEKQAVDFTLSQISLGLDNQHRQMSELLEVLATQLAAERSTAWILDDARGELVGSAGTGWPAETLNRWRKGELRPRLPLGGTVAGRVSRSGLGEIDSVTSDDGWTSHLWLPLEYGGLSLGVMQFSRSPGQRGFEEELLSRAHEMARSVAAALRQSQLYAQAVRDPGTGVYIQSHLYRCLEDEINRARRYNRPVAVLAVTLDRLFSLRPRLGHLLTNQLHAEFVNLVGDCVRETDVIGHLGSDSLAILGLEMDSSGARLLAQRIVHRARDNHLLKRFDVTPAIGICTYPDRAGCAQRLLCRAELARDLAMRVRERVHVYLSYRAA